MKPGLVFGLTSFILVFVASSSIPLQSESCAATITLDFDSAIPGVLLEDDYFEDGSRMSLPNSEHYDLISGEVQIDTFALGFTTSTLRFDSFGKSFDFLSVDVTLWEKINDPGSGSGEEFAFVTSSAGGYFDITDIGLLNFAGPDWTDIYWVDFSLRDPIPDPEQDDLRIDNLKFNVPEPSVMFLVVAGLAAVVAVVVVRRKSARVGH